MFNNTFIEYMVCDGHGIIYTSKMGWEHCEGYPRRPSECNFMIPPTSWEIE